MGFRASALRGSAVGRLHRCFHHPYQPLCPRCSFDIPRAPPRSQQPSRLPVPPRQTPSPGFPAPHGRRTWPGMDRETRVFAESHFRGLEGRLPSRVCPKLDRVDFIEKPDSFSYADFFKGYLLPNLPCVFSSAFTEDWGSRRLWVTPSGKPNFDYLLQNYGKDWAGIPWSARSGLDSDLSQTVRAEMRRAREGLREAGHENSLETV